MSLRSLANLVVLILLAALAACQNPREKADGLAQAARNYLEAGDIAAADKAIIEAIQLRICPDCGESNFAEVEAFAGEGRVALSSWMGPGGADCEVIVLTLEGVMTASLGDWIIRGVKGEFYPCKPDIFAATYEAVDTP